MPWLVGVWKPPREGGTVADTFLPVVDVPDLVGTRAWATEAGGLLHGSFVAAELELRRRSTTRPKPPSAAAAAPAAPAAEAETTKWAVFRFWKTPRSMKPGCCVRFRHGPLASP